CTALFSLIFALAPYRSHRHLHSFPTRRSSDLIDRGDRRAGWALGWSFFTIGMVKKVLIADTIAAAINPALADVTTLSTGSAWLCLLGYAYQIYFDFSGYSDMAVGLGHLFGLRIPQNFNSPYQALDISDFWRRWHISLSTCLRDYLYIPLGGNRGRRTLRFAYVRHATPAAARGRGVARCVVRARSARHLRRSPHAVPLLPVLT